MPQLKPRARPEPEVDWCEALMFADGPSEVLMRDEDALAAMRDPTIYASSPLPPLLWKTVHSWPDGAQTWDKFIRQVWAATDEKLTAKREEKINA